MVCVNWFHKDSKSIDNAATLLLRSWLNDLLCWSKQLWKLHTGEDIHRLQQEACDTASCPRSTVMVAAPCWRWVSMWRRRCDWQQQPFQFSALSTNCEDRWIFGQKCTRLHLNDLSFRWLTFSNKRWKRVLNLNTANWNWHKYTELEINKHFPQLSPLYLPASDRSDMCTQRAGAGWSLSRRSHSKAIFVPTIEMEKMLIYGQILLVKVSRIRTKRQKVRSKTQTNYQKKKIQPKINKDNQK